MTLGDKIRIFRNMRGLSQEALAHELGMSAAGYAKIEQGKTEVSHARLQQIAEKLQTKAEYITGFNEGHVFNNYSNASHIGMGVNTFSAISEQERQSLENERQQYRERIAHLEGEVAYLRSLVARLTKD